MSAFLSLPREVRDMIYRFCLERDFIIVPHPTTRNEKRIHRRQNDLPSVALLATNKQLRAEARAILYFNNEWCIPVLYRKMDDNIFNIIEPRLFPKLDQVYFRKKDIWGFSERSIVSRLHKQRPHCEYYYSSTSENEVGKGIGREVIICHPDREDLWLTVVNWGPTKSTQKGTMEVPED